MKVNYSNLFPFSTGQFFFLYNGEDGIIYSSTDEINSLLSNMVEEDTVNEKVEKYIITTVNKNTNQKTQIRHCTQITNSQWLNGRVVHKLWLSLTELCNMNCTYCFGEYGERLDHSIMSKETAKQCIDYFFKYANKDIDYYNIRFFGGEPLLNSEVLEFSINYINEKAKIINKRISYLITTNGTIMNDNIMKLIIENNISINISIDGNRIAHDSNRVFKNKTGSFDKVLECVHALKDRDYKNIIARMTLSKSGVATFKEDIMYLWSIGFNNIYFDIVETSKEELLLNLNDIKLLDQQLGEIINLMLKENLKGNFNSIRNITDVYLFIDKQLLKEACMYFNPFTIQFTPDGKIYKCCRTLKGEKNYSGNIVEGIDWNNFNREFFYDECCDECWAKRLCGGGCRAIKHKKLYCEFTKMIYKNSLIYYVLMKNNLVEMLL